MGVSESHGPFTSGDPTSPSLSVWICKSGAWFTESEGAPGGQRQEVRDQKHHCWLEDRGPRDNEREWPRGAEGRPHLRPSKETGSTRRA